ncbi:MAG: response regulator transcription factor [Candidatus Protistobacter heckmanni]|nr:response regulator transcription factor [Candidatus Protistobacter heckmanni]
MRHVNNDSQDRNIVRARLVDDDAQIRELLGNFLQGYQILMDGAKNGQEMRAALRERRYDVIMLDLMMPGENGLHLCQELRQSDDTPVIMLTALGEPTERIVGLEAGADDYVVKPFDPRELVARIQAVLRRARPGAVANDARSARELSFSGWTLNRMSRQVTSPEGLIVALSNAEYRLLSTFIDRPEQILTREYLVEKCRNRDFAEFDRSIDMLISRLRQKLEADPKGPRLIRTIRGEGYIFDSKVSI